MKAIRSALSRIIGPRLQIIIAAVLLIIGIGAGGVLIYNYVTLTRNVSNNFSPAAQRLPQLAALRNTVVQLDAASAYTLAQDVPDFSTTDRLRSSLQSNLTVMQSYAADDPDYAKVFEAVNTLLLIYDKNMDTFRGDNTSVAMVKFEIRRSFDVAENELDAVYQRQENDFINATTDTIKSISNIQLGLIVVGAVVLALGATLVLSIRRASRRESLLASGRLQVAAEIGQAAASVLSLDQLFDTALDLIVQRFGYYYASAYLIDENGEYAVLRAATGEAGQNLISIGHKVLVGSNSTIGSVTFNGRAMVYSEARRQTEYFKTELIAATRSEMAVPLRQGGQVIGALDVQSLEADPFTDADQTVMQTLADQIAVAIGNAAEFTREQVRARQMAALSQASVQLTGPQINLTTLQETVIKEAQGLLTTDDVGLWLPVGVEELELKASAAQADQLGRRLKRGEGVSGEVFQTGKPLRIDDYGRWSGRSRQQASAGIQSAMALPLLWQGEVIGSLTLTRNQVNRPFTADEEQIAQLYASQIASALENNRLLQETQDRVNELFTLNQVGQAIAAQTNLTSLFDVVRQEVTRSLNTKSFYVAFYNQDTDSVALPYMYEDGAVHSIPAFPLGPGFTSHIIRNNQPLKIDRLEDAAALNPLQSGSPAQSYLGVPIVQGERVLGVLAVQDTERPNAYTDADQRLLMTIAGQVGLAIQNIRLLEQTRRSAQELTSLNRISNIAISVRELQSVLEGAAKEIVTIFKARNCGIALFDPSGQNATVVADANRDSGEPSARGIVIPMEGNLSAQQVVETRSSVNIADPQTDPLTAPLHELMKQRNTTALMIVPLLVRGTVIGTVGIDSDDPDRDFTKEEQQLAETLVAPLSSAIDNNQLLEDARRRADQLAAAAQISRAAISILDPNQLITRAAELIRERFNLYYVAIFILDESNQWANLRYATGEAGQRLMAINHRLGVGSQSMVGTAIATQKARIALDVGQEAVRFNNPYLPDTHSEMALPLAAGGRAIGALDVQSTNYRAFSDEDVTILQTLTDQLAVALENSRLFTQTESRATELEEARSVLDSIVESLPLMLFVKDAQELRFTRWNRAGEELVGQSREMMVGKNDFDLFPPDQAELFSAQDREVIAGGKLVDIPEEPLQTANQGLRFIHTRKIPIFAPDGQPLYLLGISEDITERKAAEESLRRQNQQRAAAAEVSQVTISALDPNELITQVTDVIREKFDLYYAALFLADDNRQWANLHYATGEAGQILLARRHRLEIGGQSMVGTAISRRTARIALDVGQEAVRFNNPLLPDTRSEMALPLVAGNIVIGALDVQSTQSGAFSEADVTVLQTMANQIAIAIQNARSFTATQRRAQTEQLLNRVSTKLRTALDADSIMKVAMSEIQAALGARRVVAQLGQQPQPEAPSATRAATPATGPLKETGPLPTNLAAPSNTSPGNGHSTGNGNGYGYGNGNGNGNGNGHNGNGHGPQNGNLSV